MPLPDGKNPRSVKLADLWLEDTNRRTYSEIVNKPPKDVVGKNVFNVWVDYTFEHTFANPNVYSEESPEVQVVINHFYRCLGRNEGTEQFIDWFCHIIQNPGKRATIYPCLMGAYGCGKSFFFEFMKALLGKDICLEIQDPSLILGKFNSLLMTHKLFCLDDTSPEAMKRYGNITKFFATNERISVTEFKKNSVTINNYFNLMFFTNSDSQPMGFKMTENERRTLLLQALNDMIGNEEYFNTLGESVANSEVMRAVFKYFRTRPYKPLVKPVMTELKKQEIKKEESSEIKFIRWCIEEGKIRAGKKVYNDHMEIQMAEFKYEMPECKKLTKISLGMWLVKQAGSEKYREDKRRWWVFTQPFVEKYQAEVPVVEPADEFAPAVIQGAAPDVPIAVPVAVPVDDFVAVAVAVEETPLTGVKRDREEEPESEDSPEPKLQKLSD